MTEPFDPDMTVSESVADFENRLAEFEEGAQLIAAPLGTLLRQIAFSRQQYAEAADRGATTTGELARLVPVVEEAMAVTAWLRGDH